MAGGILAIGATVKRATSKSNASYEALRRQLGDRSVVMIGLMGCGKSSVGRRLANAIGLPFTDADEEIERAAGKSIPDIFADYGEAHFRDRECRIIERLLRTGPQILATGGGAYMRPETRQMIAASGIAVWLRADLPVLMNRVLRRDNRPLLKTADPEAKMRELINERYPVYALADITVDSRETSHEDTVRQVISALERYTGDTLHLRSGHRDD